MLASNQTNNQTSNLSNKETIMKKQQDNSSKHRKLNFGAPMMDDTEQALAEGLDRINQAASTAATVSTGSPARQSTPEPTKGVQADVPMSLYLRLNAIKYRRNQPLCALMVEALQTWADIQDGK